MKTSEGGELTPDQQPPEVPPQHLGTTIEGQARKDKA
jgi:hypothetical protein